MAIKIQIRRDIASQWTTNNPILADGELGFETDTGRLKIGDGATAWTGLIYRFEPTNDHGSLGGLGDDDHVQYHNDSRGDARYYTQTQLNTGQLDTRYFTEAEVTASQDAQDLVIATKYDASNPSGYETPSELDSRDVDNRDRSNHTGTQLASTISDLTARIKTDETTTSLSFSANTLSYTDEDGVVTNIDLTTFLDDTNLARITSGTLDGVTGIATFTRDDSSTFTVDFSDLNDQAAINTAISNHEAASDPHPQYQTSAESQAQVDAHANLINNPHQVTFTQSVSQDSGTDITASEAETLSDGSNADSLHVHSSIESPDGLTSARVTDGDFEVIVSNESSLEILSPFRHVNLPFGGQQIKNVADPTAIQDVATKNYVDSANATQDVAIASLQNSQTTQDVAIALNTAKVSADGSIDTHSDVDTTTAPPSIDSQLTWDGINWVPKSIDNGFTIFPIWAEENATLANGEAEWSFGNGSTGQVGIAMGINCELFAISFNAETFGTSVSVDIERNGSSVTTPNFISNNQVIAITAIPYDQGDLCSFVTNTVSGTTTDARICAWFRVASSALFPTPDRSVVDNSGVAFTSTTWATIPSLTTTVTINDTGTVDGTLIYSAARSGATNAAADFRIVINGTNGLAFSDTLSTFNDTGGASFFVENLAAGTYTVSAQAQTTQPITIASCQLTAVGVES